MLICVFKDKKPQKAATKESVQDSSSSNKDMSPPKLPVQRPSKEEAVKGISKGKKLEKAATKDSAPGPCSSSNDVQLQTPQSGQSAEEKTAPGAIKNKKPASSASKAKKPAPGASKRKQSFQLPPGKTKNCMDYPKHFPLHILGSLDPLEDTDPPESLLPSLSEKAKGKQPETTNTIVGYKRMLVSILRIPIAKDGPLTRVKVAVRGDTASRHWQTFFFKSIVCLEPRWGWTNDKAHVATRIVRLKMVDGTPTPYFLMVCIGEYPKITSPRNGNEVFKGLEAEPIYNDAFVFKLGDPELGESGYANYVDIDKDIDGFDWLREAIRGAARKVEWAMARHANPGFPDMSKYADEETMVKDVGDMLHVRAAIEKANKKYAAAIAGPVEAEFGLPRLESMHDRANIMLGQIRKWISKGVLFEEGAAESIIDQAANASGLKTIEVFSAIEEALTATKMDKDPSASTDVDSPSAKTKELCERAEECFMGAQSAYESLTALVRKKIEEKNQELSRIRDSNVKCDTVWLEYLLKAVLLGIVEVKKDPKNIRALKSGDPNMKANDLLGVKAQAAYQAIEENKPYQEIIQLIIEMNEILSRSS